MNTCQNCRFFVPEYDGAGEGACYHDPPQVLAVLTRAPYCEPAPELIHARPQVDAADPTCAGYEGRS